MDRLNDRNGKESLPNQVLSPEDRQDLEIAKSPSEVKYRAKSELAKYEITDLIFDLPPKSIDNYLKRWTEFQTRIDSFDYKTAHLAYVLLKSFLLEAKGVEQLELIFARFEQLLTSENIKEKVFFCSLLVKNQSGTGKGDVELLDLAIKIVDAITRTSSLENDQIEFILYKVANLTNFTTFVELIDNDELFEKFINHYLLNEDQFYLVDTVLSKPVFRLWKGEPSLLLSLASFTEYCKNPLAVLGNSEFLNLFGDIKELADLCRKIEDMVKSRFKNITKYSIKIDVSDLSILPYDLVEKFNFPLFIFNMIKKLGIRVESVSEIIDLSKKVLEFVPESRTDMLILSMVLMNRVLEDSNTGALDQFMELFNRAKSYRFGELVLKFIATPRFNKVIFDFDSFEEVLDKLGIVMSYDDVFTHFETKITELGRPVETIEELESIINEIK